MSKDYFLYQQLITLSPFFVNQVGKHDGKLRLFYLACFYQLNRYLYYVHKLRIINDANGRGVALLFSCSTLICFYQR